MNLEPAAHRRDPETSFKAAADSHGFAKHHEALILALITAHPGRTSAELAAASDGALDRWQVARRLRVMANLGQITEGSARSCSVCGRACVTWNPTAPPARRNWVPEQQALDLVGESSPSRS